MTEQIHYALGVNGKVILEGTTLENVTDVSLNLTRGEADTTTRRNQGWKTTAATLREASAEFTMMFDPSGDPGYSRLKQSYLAEEPDPVSMSFLTGTGGEGPSGKWEVTSISREEPLEDVIKVSVSLKMAEFESWN